MVKRIVKAETRLKNTAKQHQLYYNSKGERLASVTGILNIKSKPALMPWSNKLGLKGIRLEDHLKVLADIGTLAHYLCECEVKELIPELSLYSPAQIEVASICLEKFRRWREDNFFEVLETELSLVSEEHSYGGTMDLYCKLRGKYTVIDYKTGSGLYLENKVQGSAYKQLLLENGKPCEEVILLKLGRNANEGTEECIVPTGGELFEAFLALKEAHYAWKKIEGV